MGEVTAELLSAYHDRELGLEETSRLRRSLAADVEARAVLDAFDRIDDAVRESFAEDLDAPISLDLARAVRSGLAARRRRAIGRTVLRCHAGGRGSRRIGCEPFGIFLKVFGILL